MYPTSANAALTKLLLLNKRQITQYPPMRSMAVGVIKSPRADKTILAVPRPT